MKLSKKKIAAPVVLTLVLFASYIYYQILPAKPLPGEIVDSLFALRETCALGHVRAVYLFGGETTENAEIKFFIGPKKILRRLSRQDVFAGRDEGWLMRWVQGEYPVRGLWGKEAIQDEDLLTKLVHFDIEEGPGFSGESVRAVLCYIVERDGDLYEYGVRLASKDALCIGNDWQSEDLRRVFLEIEQKYHLKFMDIL
ncbi:MAG TPA: hypothetical protein PK054_02945 [Anaerohalosphaeraceae bacterium]|nr:hypothetical protein [Anaerohalosphaeraceae bacterium]HOL90095.1 hypothetical protein [Anaerohalosphaeraceae bacterium]HPP55519.1 hypothetical protein [Anaerohalosphaeraceae bacterium]